MNHPLAFTPAMTIGICAPSSAITRDRFDAGLSVLHGHGFKTIIHPQTYIGADTGNQLCGTPQEKAAALMDVWKDPAVDAITVACGGNFSAQILSHLDMDFIRHHPKPIMGFSDTTALLSAFYAAGIRGGIFGPTVQTWGRLPDPAIGFDSLSGKKTVMLPFDGFISSDIFSLPKNPAPVFVATLSVLLSLAGTQYFPDLAGHIVIVEDVGEELSHLDRALWQFNAVCPFANLAALGFGDFVDVKDTGRPLGMGFNDILRHHTKNVEIPVMTGLPIGHGQRLVPITLGRMATLDATTRTLILH